MPWVREESSRESSAGASLPWFKEDNSSKRSQISQLQAHSALQKHRNSSSEHLDFERCNQEQRRTLDIMPYKWTRVQDLGSNRDDKRDSSKQQSSKSSQVKHKSRSSGKTRARRQRKESIRQTFRGGDYHCGPWKGTSLLLRNSDPFSLTV